MAFTRARSCAGERRALDWARFVIVIAILIDAHVVAAQAHGEALRACEPAGRPWISVVFMGEAFGSSLAAAVLADLRAGLALRGIAVCAFGSAGSEAPLGLLELKALPGDRVTVSIELHDALTAKRVQRDLDLGAVAQDARALLIADAADELLRASWAELAIADAPSPRRPPPQAVEHALASSFEPTRVRLPSRSAAARGAFEYHAGGVALGGPELALGTWFSERIGSELAFGLREGFARNAAHGVVDASALVASAAMKFALTPRRERFACALALGLTLASVRMRGEASAGGIGRDASALDLHAHAGLLALVAFTGAIALRADVGFGVPIQSVRARDTGKLVTSTGGVQLFAALGPELRF